MFKRIATALVLIPLALLGVFKLDQNYFAVCAAALCMIGAYEWGAFCDLKPVFYRILYAVTYLLPFLAIWLYKDDKAFVFSLLLLNLIFWLCAFFWMYRYSKSEQPVDLSNMAKLATGYMTIAPMWLALFSIQSVSPWIIIWLFFIIWGADSGAYFVGRKFGKKKLAEKLSPKKTMEGVYGGVVTSAIIAVVGIYLLKIEVRTIPYWVVLAIITVLFSIAGDLFESMLKRLKGIKDSGSIFPGHGGVMDRIDSLTSAAPLFFFGMLLMNLVQAK